MQTLQHESDALHAWEALKRIAQRDDIPELLPDPHPTGNLNNKRTNNDNDNDGDHEGDDDDDDASSVNSTTATADIGALPSEEDAFVDDIDCSASAMTSGYDDYDMSSTEEEEEEEDDDHDVNYVNEAAKQQTLTKKKGGINVGADVCISKAALQWWLCQATHTGTASGSVSRRGSSIASDADHSAAENTTTSMGITSSTSRNFLWLQERYADLFPVFVTRCYECLTTVGAHSASVHRTAFVKWYSAIFRPCIRFVRQYLLSLLDVWGRRYCCCCSGYCWLTLRHCVHHSDTDDDDDCHDDVLLSYVYAVQASRA